MDIPIILSFDNNYAPYAGVAAYSALKNKKVDTNFCFYFLVQSNFREKYRQKLDALCNKYACEAKFIDMKDEFTGSKTWQYFTTPVYYRLSLSYLISADKCIYLDCDTLILDDLSKFFEIDIGQYYAAGVLDVLNINKPRYLTRVNICEPMTYINTGAILLNLKNFRGKNIEKGMIDLVNDKNFQKFSKFPDQDALNKACSGHVKILSPEFNWFDCFIKNFRENLFMKRLYPKINLQNLKPVIVHFVGDRKPWNNTTQARGNFENMWWQYAQETEFCSEIFAKAVEHEKKFAEHAIRNRFKNLASYWKCKALSHLYTGLQKEHYRLKAEKMRDQLRLARETLCSR